MREKYEQYLFLKPRFTMCLNVKALYLCEQNSLAFGGNITSPELWSTVDEWRKVMAWVIKETANVIHSGHIKGRNQAGQLDSYTWILWSSIFGEQTCKALLNDYYHKWLPSH